MPPADNPALLPAGLRDVLPPDADRAADVQEALRACMRAHGYERVTPPLLEFEASLLAGPGAAMERETFRLMDPVSHRMMGLRADITVQIARIATSRLSAAPRPLRISYAGDVMRVTGTHQRPERQFTQVGAELIGDNSAAADAEVVLLAVECLARVGVDRLSVDLTLPTLVPALMDALDMPAKSRDRLVQALGRKDAAQTAAVAGDHGEIFARLLDMCGPAADGVSALEAVGLPESARIEARRLAEVAARIARDAPEISLTIDPVENRGLEYHTGVSFTILRQGLRGDLAAGGRYMAEPAIAPDESQGLAGEPATGVTLYLDTVLRALGEASPPRRILVPADTPRQTAAQLREEDWITVPLLDPTISDRTRLVAEAQRQACDHVLADGVPLPVDGS